MNEDQKQKASEGQGQGAQSRAARSTKKIRRHGKGQSGEEERFERSSKKAAEIIAEASAGSGDPGEAIAKACTARAHALHAVLSNRKFPTA